MNHENSSDPLSTPDVTDLNAARRRALLVRMGKGAAALSVLAPLASRASGTHKLLNSSLPGYGYCTVSGFQSAAVSGAPATTCSAYAPSHFLTTESLTYSLLTGPNVAVDSASLATALNTRFTLNGSGAITASQVAITLLATPGAWLVVPNKNLVIRPLTSNTGTAFRGQNFPSVSLDSTGLFSSIFPSTDGRTLLEVLSDGVISTNPATAKCYFLSAYLTVYNSTPATLPQGFGKAYVVGQYSDADAASGTNAYLFFKTLCGA